MERYFKASLGFVMLAVMGISVACKTEKKGCTGCCEVPGVTKEIVMPITKEKVTLQFYNVITPVNYPYFEYDANKNKIPGTWRPNYDTVYNETGIVHNDVFEIGNYDPQQFSDNNLRTFLRIEKENDTANIWPNSNRSHESGKNYGGGVVYSGSKDGYDLNAHGTYERRDHASGRYRYKFMIYQKFYESYEPFVNVPPADTLDLFLNHFDIYMDSIAKRGTPIEGTEKELLIDSVVGVFCIIRNDFDCPINSCVGKDAGDPLLK